MGLRAYLERMTTDSHSLQHLLRIAGVRPASYRKADMIEALGSFLSSRDNLEQVWNCLNPLERELLQEYVLSDGQLEEKEIRQIFGRHAAAPPKSVPSWRSFAEWFPDQSKARLFFLDGKMPPVFRDLLKKKIDLPAVSYTPADDGKFEDEGLREAVIGDDFAMDIVNVVKLVNRTRLRATAASGLPTKAAFTKIDAVLGHKEFLGSDTAAIGDFRSIEQTTRHYGLAMLLLEAGVIEEKDGLLQPGVNAPSFLLSGASGQCSLLLRAYLQSRRICELFRIREIRTRIQAGGSLEPCRRLILGYLAHCPVGVWIEARQLLHQIKRRNRNFLKEALGGIEVYDEYQRFYYANSLEWFELEGRFVEVALIEYLTAMGIVDVTYSEIDGGGYGDLSYLSVEHLRLTRLGAYVLGVSEAYGEPEAAAADEHAGLVVQPDYEIVLQSGRMRDVHALFFDRWAEQVSGGGVSVYRLTFKGIVNALDQGIGIPEIIAYLREYCINPLPGNVLLALQEWERESRRVTIRTVTVLEADDPCLLQELRSYKAIGQAVLEELPNAVVVDGGKALKLKREIEKRSRYCNLSAEVRAPAAQAPDPDAGSGRCIVISGAGGGGKGRRGRPRGRGSRARGD